MSVSQLNFDNKENIHNISDYSVIDIINYGSFGTCYKVKRKSLNKLYVWKAIDYGTMSNHDKEQLQAEVKLMDTCTLSHPNIIRNYGSIVHGDSGTLYVTLEYCHSGNLDSLIHSCKLNQQLIEEKFIWKVLYQTAKALEALYFFSLHRTISHLNIKPSNVFLDKNYNVKLGDYGLTKIFQRKKSFSKMVSDIYYISLEQIYESNKVRKSDVWALGCLLLELCKLESSFGNNIEALKLEISQNRLIRLPSVYSENLDKIVKLLLNFDQQIQPSVETVVHHPTVICNYDKNAVPVCKMNIKCKYGKTTKDLTYFDPLKIEMNENSEVTGSKASYAARPLSLVSYDPKEITEQVYNEKLIHRLKLLQVKETELKVKEDSLKTKEQYLITIESKLAQKQKQIEKREREIDVLQRNNTLNSRKRDEKVFKTYNMYRKTEKKCIDLESTTCSADPGDTSVRPTTAKIDPSKITKPLFFQSNNLSTHDDNRINQISSEQCNKVPLNRKVSEFRRVKTYATLKKCKQLISKK